MVNLATFNDWESLESIRTKLNTNFVPKIQNKFQATDEVIIENKSDIEALQDEVVTEIVDGANTTAEKVGANSYKVNITPWVWLWDVLSQAENTFSANQNFSEITGISSDWVVGYWHGGNQKDNITILDGSPNTKNNWTPTGYGFNDGLISWIWLTIENWWFKKTWQSSIDVTWLVNLITNKFIAYFEIDWATHSWDFRRYFEFWWFAKWGFSVQSTTSANSNRLDFYLWSAGGWSNNTTSTLPASWITKVMCEYNWTTLRIYHNNVSVSSNNWTYTAPTNSPNSYIFQNWIRFDFFNNLRIWSWVDMTEAERTAEHNSDLPVKVDWLILSMSWKHFAWTPASPSLIYDMKYVGKLKDNLTCFFFDWVDDVITAPLVVTNYMIWYQTTWTPISIASDNWVTYVNWELWTPAIVPFFQNWSNVELWKTWTSTFFTWKAIYVFCSKSLWVNTIKNFHNRTKPLFTDNNPAWYTGTFWADEMLAKEGFITFAPNGTAYRISVGNSWNLTTNTL
jgi:hypothetical protein